ncbi:hypothetical protein AKJ51_03500 [candidate division MSBL1 archaeon SCGC-AAA382A20]|uniref:PIN domain-containing protein n=1 Tax=candidate division MSBL1 archaeon SCGC-AAA382A20 TaxID=1698280 RepID=A0A133VJE2_9EURY|nr:hypothetical protein AKJ51_03500 [candidate division MSBL1 archaeon SCGC-AAA382A20]
MTGGEIKSNLDELQILINLIGGTLKISFPLYSDFEMIRASPGADGYSLKALVDKNDFENQINEFDRQREELPSYRDFVDCLLSSGIISYENLEKVEKRINYERKNALGKVLFCPDTNILYHNFLSSLERIDPENVGIVTTVKDEIEASMNYKYSDSDIRGIKDSASCQPGLLNELSNRRKKKSRKAAYLAKREYKKFGGREIPAGKESTDDREENDRTIAKSLSKYEKENNVRTLLLTADTQMADICEMESVDRFYLKYPESYSLNKCSHREFLKLIFDLSVTFGFIKINSVLVFGEFGGKGPDEPDRMKLKFLDKGIFAEFKKHQKICKCLAQLDIKKY